MSRISVLILVSGSGKNGSVFIQITFYYAIAQTGEGLECVSRLVIKNSIFEPEVYLELKDFFDKVVEKHLENVVLVKKP